MKATIFSLDTNVLISHLKGDKLADETDQFFQRMIEKNIGLIMADIVYAELYAGIYLSEDPSSEETRVQRFLSVNRIEVRMSGSLKIARRAGEIYSKYLSGKRSFRRILPDFLIASQAEAASEAFVTWNGSDYENLGLKIPVLSPKLA